MRIHVGSRGIDSCMAWLLNREVVIGLAIGGGVLSVAATAFAGSIGRARAALLLRLAYVCMGASMILFVVIGFMSMH